MSITLGGLASGLDTNTMIDQLMAIERQPQTRMQLQQLTVQARQDVLRDIGTRLRALDAAAASLRSVTTWADTQTVAASDPTRVEARRVSGAAAGGYQVEVSQLARAEQRTYAFAPPAAATQLTINGKTVDVEAGATLADVVASVNSTTGIAVYATAVDGRLVLSGRATGAVNGIAASSSTLTEDTTVAKAARDALYTVDGVAHSSASNVVSDGIVGLELTLKSVTTGPATVNVGAPSADTEKVKTAVQALLDAYNGTVDFIRTKLNERPVANPTSTADAAKGAVYADSMLNGLLAQLRGSISVAIGGAPSDLDELTEIGISTGATTGGGTVSSTAIAGKLVLDVTKLTDALLRDPTTVRRMLGGDATTTGLGGRFSALIQPVTNTGGLLDSRLTGATSELKRVTDQIAQMGVRLDMREKAMRAKFTAMETALQASQSQGQWLSAQLAGLAR